MDIIKKYLTESSDDNFDQPLSYENHDKVKINYNQCYNETKYDEVRFT